MSLLSKKFNGLSALFTALIMTAAIMVFAGCEEPSGSESDPDDITEAPLTVNGGWETFQLISKYQVYYSFPVLEGETYRVYWNDLTAASGFTADIRVGVYMADNMSSYFASNENGLTLPGEFIADETATLRLSVAAQDFFDPVLGSYALRIVHVVPIEDFSFNAPPSILTTGTASTIEVSITPDSADKSALWSSTDDSIVFVEQDGTVTALDEGSATVSAVSEWNNSESDSCSITAQIMNWSMDNLWHELYLPPTGNDLWISFDGEADKSYAIYANSGYEGDSQYTGKIRVSAYQADKATSYFSSGQFLYTSPQIITPSETGKIYLKFAGLTPAECGEFGLKIREFNEPTKSTTWTVMMYMDGDNDLETELLQDIQEVKEGLNDNSVNVICLFDRISGESSNSTILGSNFTDARLFRLIPDDYIPLSGGTRFPDITAGTGIEINMGAAGNLQKFIQYCKENYPADNYVLVMSNHGGGVRSRALGGGNPSQDGTTRAICYDDTSSGDCLYTAEITDVLTSAESVDLLVLDACLMGNLEVGYQYRPGTGDFSADYLVASSPLVWGNGLDYDSVFERISEGSTGDNGTTAQITGGMESLYDPDTMTVQQFGGLFIEEQRDSVEAAGDSDDESMALLDLSKAAGVQTALNTLAVELTAHDVIPTATRNNFQSVIFGSGSTLATLNYFDESDYGDWISNPHVDLYAMANRLYTGSGTHADVKTAAGTLRTAAADMVINSYGGTSYGGFVIGTNGLGIFCPFGNLAVNTDSDGLADDGPAFAYQWWYNSLDTTTAAGFGPTYKYGKLASCAAGATEDNDIVENWFELLDYWYDLRDLDGNMVEEGGWNSYLY